MNKETQKPKKGNMKKNKTKTPVVPKVTSNDKMTKNKMVSKIVKEGVANTMMDLVYKKSSKMGPKEQAVLKQQTLDNLRESIRNMVEKSATHEQKNVTPPSDIKNPYAINPHGSAVDPNNNIHELIKQKPLNEQETEFLRCRISEYLKSFAIFGYDMNGNRVLITTCKTMQERDSIFEMSKHIPQVLFSLFNNGRNPMDMDDTFG